VLPTKYSCPGTLRVIGIKTVPVDGISRSVHGGTEPSSPIIRFPALAKMVKRKRACVTHVPEAFDDRRKIDRVAKTEWRKPSACGSSNRPWDERADARNDRAFRVKTASRQSARPLHLGSPQSSG
jgi:hypothetical protein